MITMNFAPVSHLPGIIWPAISHNQASLSMAIQFQLSQSQWWTPEEILKKQMEQLGPLLQHAYRNCQFYQELYRSAGFRPKHLLTPALWENVPIVTRENIQNAGDKLISKNVPAQHGEATQISTSGSTGREITVLSNQVTQLFNRAHNLRDHLWQKRNLRGKLAAIRLSGISSGKPKATPPDGIAANSWGVSTDIYKTGPSALLDISANIDEQLHWLVKQNPEYLLTYPSNLAALLDKITENKITLDRLLQVRSLGEIVKPDLRKRCREILGVPLVDAYSCQEIGCLALQCPDNDHYHIQSESVLLEVLNDDDQPCEPGEIGRVVVTSLHNFATPLIRYEIGDLAELGNQCACGRGLPVINQIMGRVRNMLTYPNGEKRWPFFGSASFKEIATIQQFQFIQTALNQIEVHLVVQEALNAQQQLSFTQLLHKNLGYEFELTFHYHEEIKRTAGGKFEDFISKI